MTVEKRSPLPGAWRGEGWKGEGQREKIPGKENWSSCER